MAKERKKKNSPQSTTPINVSLPVGMSAEEMQHVIAKALVEAEELKEQKKNEQREKEHAEWRKDIGYKDYSDKTPFKNGILTFFNRLFCFFKVMFIPAKKVKGDMASFGLLQMSVSACFSIANFISFFAFVLLFFGGIASFFIPMDPPLPWITSLWSIFIGLGCFMFSRMFRMASIEIQKIEDRNYLFGIFASLASIVSIIIAIVSIAKGG
jgi:hypothetical protein